VQALGLQTFQTFSLSLVSNDIVGLFLGDQPTILKLVAQLQNCTRKIGKSFEKGDVRKLFYLRETRSWRMESMSSGKKQNLLFFNDF
jgi:hypothetical protein